MMIRKLEYLDSGDENEGWWASDENGISVFAGSTRDEAVAMLATWERDGTNPYAELIAELRGENS